LPNFSATLFLRVLYAFFVCFCALPRPACVQGHAAATETTAPLCMPFLIFDAHAGTVGVHAQALHADPPAGRRGRGLAPCAAVAAADF
jgi:hypothetical protein